MYLILTGEPMDYSDGLKARQQVLLARAKEIEERTRRLTHARALEMVSSPEMGKELREAFLQLRDDALVLQQANYLLYADAIGEQIERERKRPLGPSSFDGVVVPDGMPPKL